MLEKGIISLPRACLKAFMRAQENYAMTSLKDHKTEGENSVEKRRRHSFSQEEYSRIDLGRTVSSIPEANFISFSRVAKQYISGL